MSRLFSMRKVATPALVNREFTRAHFSQHTAMRTFTIALVALATLTACGPEPIAVDTFDEPGSPDRIAFAVEEEQDDETEGEETGDAGMDGIDPLPDAGAPEPVEPAPKCCTCAAMNCVDWDDDADACEGAYAAAIGQATAWCELDVFGGVSACAAACE